jgi:Cdc6-like AAA superfamily ATPase
MQHCDLFYKQANRLLLRNVSNVVPQISLSVPSHSSQSSISQASFPIFGVERTNVNVFVGREELLSNIHTFFTKRASDQPPFAGPACCILRGLPGIGKTSVARHYCSVHEKMFEALFSVDAESITSMQESFRTIARKLRLLDTGSTPAAVVEDVKNWFERASECSDTYSL